MTDVTAGEELLVATTWEVYDPATNSYLTVFGSELTSTANPISARIVLEQLAGLFTFSNTTIDSAGYIDVENGGSTVDTTLSAGAAEGVGAGGVAIDTVISGGVIDGPVGGAPGGQLTIQSGGSAIDTTVLDGGILALQGDAFTDTLVIDQGGELWINSGFDLDNYNTEDTFLLVGGGASVTDATVDDGGSLLLSDGPDGGALASDTTVLAGGTLAVLGPILGFTGTDITFDTVISSGGIEIISSGGVASGSIIAGGTLELFPDAADPGLVWKRGTLDVVGFSPLGVVGISVQGLTIATGQTLILNGIFPPGLPDTGKTTGNNITVNNGGTLELLGAATAPGLVWNGGTAEFGAGAVASALTVDQGAELVILADGTTTGATFINGGAETISQGGTASDTFVVAGGTQQVLGTAINAVLNDGGNAVQTVSSGGVAIGTEVNGIDSQVVLPAGVGMSTAIGSGGVETVSSGGTNDNAHISGGTLVLQSGAIVTGGINFDGVGGGTLEIGDPIDFNAPITGLTVGDTIDFPQLNPSTGALSVQMGNTGSTLDLWVDGSSIPVAYQASGNLTGVTPLIMSDNSGGTEIQFSWMGMVQVESIVNNLAPGLASVNLGSGIVIGPHSILTASHVIWSADNAPSATSVTGSAYGNFVINYFNSAGQPMNIPVSVVPFGTNSPIAVNTAEQMLGANGAEVDFLAIDDVSHNITANSNSQAYDFAVIDTPLTAPAFTAGYSPGYIPIEPDYPGGTADLEGEPGAGSTNSALYVAESGLDVQASGVFQYAPPFVPYPGGGVASPITQGFSGGPVLEATSSGVEDAGVISTSSTAVQFTLSDYAIIQQWKSGAFATLASNEFSGDGLSDLLMTDNNTGALVIDEVSGDPTMTYTQIGGLGPEWQFEGAGSFLGDGKDDELLWGSGSGAIVAAEDHSGTVSYTALGGVGPEWQFEGNGPLLGQSTDDFLLWNGSSASPDYGALVLGSVVNGSAQYTQIGGLGPEWQFEGVGDYLGDDNVGFLIENHNGGALVVGEIVNGSAQYTRIGGLGPEWQFEGSGDLLGHGQDDFLIWDGSSASPGFGALVVGEVTGGIATYTQIGAVGPEWQFLGVGDYDGQSNSEFLMRSSGSGALVIGTVADASVSYAAVGGVGLEWDFHTSNVATIA